ncbi:DNA-binding transcriptional LysR family regulator [Kribbella steppae]|uniref:DNA-binding transcriptional LysR family regulator n=1 Tax=Kribbella steppae TaxID=2512223 RepID=A0A4R2HE07_9ACTN|nr:LysR family transcriptional regulator [Kribbella steppae]TCO26572.1 DNA-binding transcriptional LysR family regulator [Kribbella steppae]
MDPHLLRTFIAVATTGSFSAAAAELGYTQSAVSQHIAALENSLGTALLTRRPVAPTPAGERLLEHAGAILLRIEAARADVRRVVGEPPGEIVFAATPLAGATRVARALTQLRQTRPGIAVTFEVARRDEVARGVASGAYHLGLVDGIAAPSDPLKLPDVGAVRTSAVAQDKLVVVLPDDHPLARRKRLGLPALVDARWIDAPDVAAPLPDLRAATETDGIRAALTYSGTDILCLLALVAAGHGLAVLPASLDLPADVAAVPVHAPRLVHRTELLYGHLDEPQATDLVAALTAPAIRRTN